MCIGASQVILEAVRARQFELIASERLLAETRKVLRPPKLMRKHGQSLAAVERFVQELHEAAQIFPITGDQQLCRGPKDDAVIETAVAGEAVFVVSDDEDLQTLEVTEFLLTYGCRVVTVGDFLRELYPLESEVDSNPSGDQA